jgi:hypothetical protein
VAATTIGTSGLPIGAAELTVADRHPLGRPAGDLEGSPCSTWRMIVGEKAKGRDKGKTAKMPKTAKAGRRGLRPHEQRQQQDALMNDASAQFMPRWEAGRQRRLGGAGGGGDPQHSRRY